jgi:hypothetical protein
VAAKLCAEGIPAIGLGGIDGWKNRTLLIGGDAALSSAGKGVLAVKMSNDEQSDADVTEEYDSPLAVGLEDLVDSLVLKRDIHVILIGETDNEDPSNTRVNSNAQRSIALFAFELRFRGIPFNRIRQLILPKIHGEFISPTVTAADVIIALGTAQMRELIETCLSDPRRFPQHPNVRDYINQRLQKRTLGRKEIQAISMAVLSDLDSHGARLRSPTLETFYFDYTTRRLMEARWPTVAKAEFDAPINQYLYRTYGLSANDNKLMIWLGTQFSAEEPIDDVSPWRTFARPDGQEDLNYVHLQLSDSQFVTVTSKGIEIHDNGYEGILFESDQCDPVDAKALLDAYERWNVSSETPECWWARTLAQVRLRDKDRQRIVAALLYYMSPWLFRWKGMQLPVELIVGESGSGKSTLCELRLDILTGRPLLRNTPTDLKDWHASVTNTGGLHVTDNVQLVDRAMRNRLSDELCRITTEPEPFIEQRKYYTNADQIRIPVRAVFALTAIQQPFQNADLLQRAFVLELDKSIDQSPTGEIRFDSNWKINQLNKHGGRTGWLAHHLVVMQRFFALVEKKWDPNYSAKQRLINFEQAIMLMAEVFGLQNSWIPDFLVKATDQHVGEADWILEGLHAFALEHNTPNIATKRFRASVIAEWCETHPDYKRNDILTNSRKLGRYLKAHRSAIYHLTGMQEAGIENNRQCYRFGQRTIERRQ